MNAKATHAHASRRISAVRPILLAAAALCAAACGSVITDRPDKPAVNRCPTGPFGGTMVEVPALDGSSYCVDATEVTNAQYAAFLATNPSLDDRPEMCRSVYFANDPSFATFVPHRFPVDPQNPSTDWPVDAEHQNQAVVNINYCAAATFCAMNGKRLCGKIGGRSLGADKEAAGQQAERIDPHISEWANACTGGGSKPYAYGSEFQSGRCPALPQAGDSGDANEDACEGGFEGLFGLGGGVTEFVDDCILDPAEDPGPNCETMGWETGLSDEAPPCRETYGVHLRVAAPYIGVRCCADVLTP